MVSHAPSMNTLVFQLTPLNLDNPAPVSETPSVAPPVPHCIFSVPQMENVTSNRVPSAILKLARKLGLSAAKLLNQVEFCVSEPFHLDPAHHAFVSTVRVALPPDGATHQPIYTETVSENVPELHSLPPAPALRAARAQLSPAPVPVPRVREVEVQLVPALVSRPAESPTSNLPCQLLHHLRLPRLHLQRYHHQ